MKRNETYLPSGAFTGKTVSDRLVAAGKQMYALEAGRCNVIANVDDLPRGEAGGYNVQKMGKLNLLYPRLSRADYDVMQFSRLPEDGGIMDSLLGSMARLPTDVADSIRATRKVVRKVGSDGRDYAMVVPAVPVAMSEAELADIEQGGDASCIFEVPPDSELRERQGRKEYKLTQLFNDSDATDKYEFPIRLVETAKRMSVINPTAAARYLQDYMNSVQNLWRVTVVAEQSHKSKALAQATLKTVGAKYDRVDVTVGATVAMDKLVIYGPGGEDDWYVQGPLRYANELSYVYWMMYHDGRIIPNVLFSIELVLLGIDVCIEGNMAEPVVQFHTGGNGTRPRSGLSEFLVSELSANQRLQIEGYAGRIVPVMGSSGEQLATAVQVTGRHAVLNTHVITSDPDCTVNGRALVVKRQLSRDVMCVESECDATPWVLRDPEEREWVTVCYMVDDVVSCSRPVQVVSISDESLVLTMDKEVGPGVSGGAVVALADMAFLGIHSGATRANLLAFRFGSQQLEDLLDGDSVSAISRPEDVGEFAEKVVTHLRDRGLQQTFTTAVGCVEPLYIGTEHVGMAIRDGNMLYTTVDPDSGFKVGSSRASPLWTTTGQVSAGARVYHARDDSRSLQATYRRAPNFYEKVFVIGFDGRAYLSSQTEVAHLGVNGRSFVIRDIAGLDRPLAGGFVMGQDGALLGICGQRNYHTVVGLGYVCFPIPRASIRVAGPDEYLRKVFPFLHIDAWPSELVEEVFTHASVGSYKSGNLFNVGCKPLANIGDAVMKTALFVEMRASGYPHPLTAKRVDTLQSNAAQARVSERLGMDKYIVVGPGTSLNKGAKAHADVLEALVGAASLIEQPGVVNQLLRTLEMLPADDTVEVTTHGAVYTSPEVYQGEFGDDIVLPEEGAVVSV